MKNGLTVIVPAYNVAKYLEECVLSLINQTRMPDQIIIIDDCSTDNTFDVAIKLAKRYQSIEVHHNERNMISRCRYEAFQYIKNRYVVFCDSDDYVDNVAYELLLTKAKKTGASIVSFSKKIGDQVIEGNEEILKKHFLEGNVSVCNLLIDIEKIHLKDLIPYKNEIDTLTSYKFFSRCEKWAIIHGAYYNYRHHNNTVSRSKFSVKDFRVIDNLNIVNLDVEANHPNILQYSYFHYIHAELDLISKYVCFGASSLSDKSRIKHLIKKFIRDFKLHYKEIVETEYFSKNEKKKICLITHSYFLFYVTLKIRHIVLSLFKKEISFSKI